MSHTFSSRTEVNVHQSNVHVPYVRYRKKLRMQRTYSRTLPMYSQRLRILRQWSKLEEMHEARARKKGA